MHIRSDVIVMYLTVRQRCVKGSAKMPPSKGKMTCFGWYMPHSNRQDLWQPEFLENSRVRNGCIYCITLGKFLNLYELQLKYE